MMKGKEFLSETMEQETHPNEEPTIEKVGEIFQVAGTKKALTDYPGYPSLAA